MTWWAVGAAAVGIIGGAISSKQNADAANRKKTTTTDQTTTQQGNYASELQPDFRQLMSLNRGLMEAGPSYIPGGHVDYSNKGWPNGGGPTAYGPPKPTGNLTPFNPNEQPQLPGSDVPPALTAISDSSHAGGLPAGARQMGDRTILASGETQGMTKQDRHRAWLDWKASRGGGA